MDFKEAYPDGKYLDSTELIGNETTIMILDVTLETIEDQRRDTSNDKPMPVVRAYGIDKPWIISAKVNYKSIARLASSQDTEKWKGTLVTLHSIIDNFFGVKQSATRVLPIVDNIDQFLEQAKTIEDLKTRHKMLGSRSKVELVKQIIAKRWPTTTK